MQIARIVIFACISISVFGCSTIDITGGYEQSDPPLPEHRALAEGEYTPNICNCDSLSVSGGLGWNTFWRIVGPPFIPLIPLPIMTGRSKVTAFIEVRFNRTDQIREMPEVLIHPIGRDTCLKPIEAKISWRDTTRIWCKYRFDLHGFSSDTLQLAFPSKYYSCDIPSVTFYATTVTEYNPLWIPNR